MHTEPVMFDRYGLFTRSSAALTPCRYEEPQQGLPVDPAATWFNAATCARLVTACTVLRVLEVGWSRLSVMQQFLYKDGCSDADRLKAGRQSIGSASSARVPNCRGAGSDDVTVTTPNVNVSCAPSPLAGMDMGMTCCRTDV